MGLLLAKYFGEKEKYKGRRDLETYSCHTVTGEYTMAGIKIIIKGSQCIFILPSQSRSA